MDQHATSKVFFAVEFRYIDGTKPVLNPDWESAMPIYLCNSGAGADAQVQEEGCFLIDDEQGRLWFCREVKKPDPNQPGYAEQFFQMGYLAHKIGIKEGGKMFHGHADDLDDLRAKLEAVT